jgi:glutathione S-transferase
MAADLTLYHIVPSRSSIVRWMLEEVGPPYEVHLLDPKQEEQRQPGYLAVNPMGKVPALVHGEVVITEAAAICCYLADAFPDAGLAPAIGDPGRGPYLKWLFFGPSCFEPAAIDRMFERKDAPRTALGWRDLETVLDVIADAVEPGPYLLGEQFTAADVVIGSGVRWGRIMGLIPEREALQAYEARLEQRPALQRAIEKDRELSTGQAG